MKKILILSLALALTLTGCGTKPDADTPRSFTNENPTGATLQLTLEGSFRSEQLLPGETLAPTFLCRAGQYLLFRNHTENDLTEGRAYDLAAGEEVVLVQHGEPLGIAETDGGFEIMWEQPDDADLNERTAVYTLARYDSTLHEQSAEDVTAQFCSEPGWDALLQSWMRTPGGGEIAVTNGHDVYCCAPDGTALGEVRGSFAGCDVVFAGKDGQLYARCAAGDCYAVRIDPEALTTERIAVPGMPTYCMGITPGNSEYTFFCMDDAALYGVDVTAGTVTPVMDFANSDVDFTEMRDFVPLPDGGFAARQFRITSPTENEITLWHFTPRTQEEIDRMHLISVAAFQMDDFTADCIRRYNRRYGEARFVVREYYSGWNSTPEDWEHAQNSFSDFQNELLAGTVPDVLCLNRAEYEQLSNKGMFEDWYAWMDSDPDFHEEDYLMPFFDSLAYQGRLERMSFRFSVNALVGKTKFVGESRPLSGEDFAALVSSMPEGMRLFGSGYDREYVLYILVRTQLDSYIDYETRTCRFDTPAFAQLLTLIRDCAPERVGVADEDAYRGDRAMLAAITLGQPHGIMQQTVGRFGEEPLTLLGCPQLAAQGNGGSFAPLGCFAVSANSLYKAEIWDFIKFALNAENQDTHGLSFDLPVNRTVLERTFAEACIPAGEDDAENWSDTRRPTQEEVQAVLDYIEHTDSAGMASTTLYSIVSEEAAVFFAGDTDAQTAAERIQGRAEIFLSETQ